jgi:Ca2+-binding EF-hand superfamily protein
MPRTRFSALAACVLLATAHAAGAQDKAAYDQRNIARYTATFAALDLDHDGAVTREEARGNLDFLPRFHDMDRDGDDIVTAAELNRFLADRFGMQMPQQAAAGIVIAPPAPQPPAR